MNQPELLVQIDRVSKHFQSAGGAVEAVKDVSVTVHAGEVMALVGPTGSGKTTLLSLMAGLEEPDAGAITLLGRRLAELNADGVTDLRSQAVGFIYQRFNLFPGFTVRENVGLPLRLMLRPPFDAHQRSAQILAELGLDELSARYPGELSMGQQQLAAIARALAANPPLILADEPTANLDTSTARQIMTRLRALADDGQHGVVIATHDLRMASQADRVLNLRDGVLIKETVMQPGKATREVLAELM
ncbi:MAG: ABC transporter ATP-binding protein [Caldilineaceae bacterium]